jgi:DNA repair photolyase
MLNPFWGEFLYSPIPLEIAYGRCDYNCRYCYELLRGSHYESHSKLTSMMNLIMKPEKFSKLNTAARLIELKYPVKFSNHVDPFCPTNLDTTRVLLRACTDTGLPVSFTTKTGKGMLEIAETLQPSVFTVTVTTLDEKLRRIIEPGAPPVDFRLNSMLELTKMGHKVISILAPHFPEAVPDVKAAEEYVVAMKEAGVSAMSIEPINFRRTHMEFARKNGIELPSPIDKYFSTEPWRFDASDLYRFAEEYGLEVYGYWWPKPSGYPDIYHECYDKTFPIFQDFINECYRIDGELNEDIYSLHLSDFVEFMAPMLPDFDIRVDDYVRVMLSSSRALREFDNPKYGKFVDVLASVWDPSRTRFRLDLMSCFAMVLVNKGGDLTRWVDEAGHNIYAFSGHLFADNFHIIDS